MIKDLTFILTRWRLVHLLGVSTLRARYARSRFGQLWLTISTIVLILSTGAVWSLLWHTPIDAYLPYVGVGHIIYLFISQTVNDSSGIFVADARLYLNDRMPFLTSVFAHVYRNILVLAHNVPTIVVLILWSASAQLAVTWMFIPAMLLAAVFIFMSSYVVAALCTRFRDLIQIVALVMQVVFLLSPIMWKVEFIPEAYRNYIFINPFASFLEILRNPLIGLEVHSMAYVSILAWDIALVAVAFLLYRRFDRSIIFWI